MRPGQKAFCSRLIGQKEAQDLSIDTLKENLRRQLTPLQYRVTQECGTEPSFSNMYWDNKQEGIYVDIVSGEPLFGSWEKFDSRTGWPSFSRPINPASIIEKRDLSSGLDRIEVRSKKGHLHLGHVFEDGPDAQGRRFCINSAALRFIPVKDLRKEGYGEYERFFA